MPSLNPTLAPSFNPTSYFDYKLHIFSNLAITCINANSLQPWFKRNTYQNFRKNVEIIFSEKGGNFLHFYQFYVEFKTMNLGQINITKQLPFTFTNVSELNEIAYLYYERSIIANIINVQWIVHSLESVETVFSDFFNNFLTRQNIQV